jgi:putative ABC transport system ATP-binding protein
MELINGKNLIKEYRNGKVITRALNGVDISVEEGEFVMIVGPSGSGKSTLLHVLGGLETYSGGFLELFGKEVSELKSKEKAALRSLKLGFVFQFYNLIPNLTAYENIRLATVFGNRANHQSIIQVLKDVGMEAYQNYYPDEMSGGMQQRIAIARSLINDPMIIFADEPTGNLDQNNGKMIMELFSSLHHNLKKTIIMVTHNEDSIKYGTRTIRMLDGRVSRDEKHLL